MSSKKILPLLFLYFTTVSCVDDLDFDQINDYSVTPEFTTALTFFKILTFQFFNSAGIQESERTDITDLRIFDNSYVKDKLIKLDFNIDIKNEFDKVFIIQIEFLNQNNSLTYRFKEIIISANDLDFNFLEEIDVNSNQNVKNTSKVRINVKLANPLLPIDPNDTTELELKSSLKLYFDTDA